MSNSLSITATRTLELPRLMSQAAGKFVFSHCQFQGATTPPRATWPGWVMVMSRGVKSRPPRSPGAAKSIRVTAGSPSRRWCAAATSPSIP